MSKRKRVSYHVQKSQKINERILSLQKELPALCTDFSVRSARLQPRLRDWLCL